MNGGRQQRQDVFSACRSRASGQRHGVSHRAALVQMPKLAFAIFLVLGVEKYATIQQSSMHITNHGADVAECRGFARKNASFGAMDIPANQRNERASEGLLHKYSGFGKYALVASSHESLLPSFAE
jgi:hypothetical protein